MLFIKAGNSLYNFYELVYSTFKHEATFKSKPELLKTLNLTFIEMFILFPVENDLDV